MAKKPVKPEIAELQNFLNSSGYKDKDGRRLSVDGLFGDKTKEAIDSFNATTMGNPALKQRGFIRYTPNGSGVQHRLDNISLVNPSGFNKQYTNLATIVKPLSTDFTLDPSTLNPDVAGSFDAPKPITPSFLQSGQPNLANLQMPSIPTGQQMLDKYNPVSDTPKGLGLSASNALSIGASGLRTILSAVGASQQMPTYQEPQDVIDYRNRLKQQSTEGLSPVQMAIAQNNITDTFNNQTSQITGAVGGGGSVGLLLGNMNQAGINRNNGLLALAGINEQRKLQNQAIYGQALNQQQATDYRNFQMAYQQAGQSKAAYGQALGANISDLGNLIADQDPEAKALKQKYYEAILNL